MAIEWDDEKSYSDANLFKQARDLLIDALKQNKFKRADTGAWEVAQTGVEYYSPKQEGGIYGAVYRQYFTTTLPSYLTSGGNVTRLVDFSMRTHIGTLYYSIHGSYRGFATGEADIQDSSNNLSLVLTTHVLDDGWVDYTK